jgi:hypothetical protein
MPPDAIQPLLLHPAVEHMPPDTQDHTKWLGVSGLGETLERMVVELVPIAAAFADRPKRTRNIMRDDKCGTWSFII